MGYRGGILAPGGDIKNPICPPRRKSIKVTRNLTNPYSYYIMLILLLDFYLEIWYNMYVRQLGRFKMLNSLPCGV